MVSERTLRYASRLNNVTDTGPDIAALEYDFVTVGQ
jgi:hypothetical protein